MTEPGCVDMAARIYHAIAQVELQPASSQLAAN